jgi:PEP-CTERM motif
MKAAPRLALTWAVALCLAMASAVQADTLSTGTNSNNGSGGIFMDLTSIGGNDLLIRSFDTQLTGTILGNYQVWTRPGTYVGFTASSAGWTLSETITGTGGGTTVTVPLSALANPISVTNGSTVAVYLHGVTTGAGIRYFGTGTTSISNYNDANLALFTNISRTGTVAFAGSQFTPRAFVGNIHYDVLAVPEPSTLGFLALAGVIGLVRRTRRNG